MLPFYAVMVLVLAMVTYTPQIGMALPRALGYWCAFTVAPAAIFNRKGTSMKIKYPLALSVLFLCYPQAVWAVTLKLSHNQDKSHPVHKAMEFFAKRAKSTLTVILLFVFIQMEHWYSTRNNGADSFWRYSTGKNQCGRNGAFENSYKLFSLPCCSAIVIIIIRSCRAISGEKSSTQRKARLFRADFLWWRRRSFYGNKPVRNQTIWKAWKSVSSQAWRSWNDQSRAVTRRHWITASCIQPYSGVWSIWQKTAWWRWPPCVTVKWQNPSALTNTLWFPMWFWWAMLRLINSPENQAVILKQLKNQWATWKTCGRGRNKNLQNWIKWAWKSTGR